MTEGARWPVPRAVVWVLAVVAFATLVLAGVLAGARLVHRHSGAAGLSKAELAAVAAAKQETINIQTYRLKSFDADFGAALAGLTSVKATQWQASKASLKAQLTQQKIDSAATVSGAGLVSFQRDTAVVVVSADILRIDSTGKSSTAAQSRLQITMRLVGGKWLMDELQSVSVS